MEETHITSHPSDGTISMLNGDDGDYNLHLTGGFSSTLLFNINAPSKTGSISNI